MPPLVLLTYEGWPHIELAGLRVHGVGQTGTPFLLLNLTRSESSVLPQGSLMLTQLQWCSLSALHPQHPPLWLRVDHHLTLWKSLESLVAEGRDSQAVASSLGLFCLEDGQCPGQQSPFHHCPSSRGTVEADREWKGSVGLAVRRVLESNKETVKALRYACSETPVTWPILVEEGCLGTPC